MGDQKKVPITKPKHSNLKTRKVREEYCLLNNKYISWARTARESFKLISALFVWFVQGLNPSWQRSVKVLTYWKSDFLAAWIPESKMISLSTLLIRQAGLKWTLSQAKLHLVFVCVGGRAIKDVWQMCQGEAACHSSLECCCVGGGFCDGRWGQSFSVLGSSANSSFSLCSTLSGPFTLTNQGNWGWKNEGWFTYKPKAKTLAQTLRWTHQ